MSSMSPGCVGCWLVETRQGFVWHHVELCAWAFPLVVPASPRGPVRRCPGDLASARLDPFGNRVGIAPCLFYSGAQDGHRVGCPVDPTRWLDGSEKRSNLVVIHPRSLARHDIEAAYALIHAAGRFQGAS